RIFCNTWKPSRSGSMTSRMISIQESWVSASSCSPSTPPYAATADRFSCSIHLIIRAQSSLSSSMITTWLMLNNLSFYRLELPHDFDHHHDFFDWDPSANMIIFLCAEEYKV